MEILLAILIPVVLVAILFPLAIFLALAHSRAKRGERSLSALDERVKRLEAAVRDLSGLPREGATAEPAASPAARPVAAPAPELRAPQPEAHVETSPVGLEQRIGARWTTWSGVVAIVFAVGFLLRWTFENNLIGPKGRVGLGVFSGLALLFGGLFLHRRRNLPFLSMGLSGGGLAILYLSVYAAHAFYGFLGAGPAFGLMFLVTIAGAGVAVATSRQPTAVLAVLGGLLTPILVSTDHPDERVLLGYLLVLSLLVLGVAAYRSWPGLNRLAWAGTVALTVPILLRHPATTQPVLRLVLLTGLFGIFLAVPLVRAWVERRPTPALDLVLLLGNPAAYSMAVYWTLEAWHPRAEAPYALALAALYVVAAVRHRRRVPEDAAAESLLVGVAVVLVAIAIPLALDGPWVTLAWAVQGAVLLTLAPKLRAAGVATCGIGALLLSAVRLAYLDPLWYPHRPPVLNLVFFVHMLVVAATAWGGACVGSLRETDRGGVDGEGFRSFLWVASVLLLAILLWREPTGLWPWALLAAELLVVAGLARVVPDRAFAIGALAVTVILLVRMLPVDQDLAAGRAASLLNAPLLSRIAVCGAIAAAGRWLARPEGARLDRMAGRLLSGSAGIVLLVVLSLGWIDHQHVALRGARASGNPARVRHVRWVLQVGLSVLWTVYAGAALAWGFARKAAPVRYVALGLLGFVIFKVFVVDLSELQAVYRVLSFLVLGLVLLGVSYLYGKWGRSFFPSKNENSPP
jgi:uncharacterized membrane protein